jgi:hypothetical protein
MTLLEETRREYHEALFLPVSVGCSRYRLGHILVAGGMGKMGDRRRGRDLGHYEPFLPDMLLPQHEEN